MSSADAKAFTLASFIQAIRLNAVRRPLWKAVSAADFLDLDRKQVMAGIEDGSFPFAFNISFSGRANHSEPRILAFSIIENRFGPDLDVGATRNLELSKVINLVLPARDVRSTELQRILSCSQQMVRKIGCDLKVTRKPGATDGPLSFTVFSRASVAAWLSSRRMI